jgi:hypothetical protein
MRPIWPHVTGSIVWIQIVELGPQSHFTPLGVGDLRLEHLDRRDLALLVAAFMALGWLSSFPSFFGFIPS